jgi:tetratricopeptide (TPR) repeat protein
LLRRYVAGEGASVLQQALKKFGAVTGAQPKSLDARLYEGITLDLLERHDEAIVRFRYVADSTDPENALYSKALYNLAVAHMRKYRPSDLQEAARIFQQVAESNPDFLKQPIGGLAAAGKANAIAHYPIFWQPLIFGRKAHDDAERMEWKGLELRKEGGPQVTTWGEEVLEIAERLRLDLPKIKVGDGYSWDETAKRQLEWAIANAIGNAQLNVATGFLEPPRPPDLGDLEQEQKQLLHRALDEFQKCEMLISPGVETLTNIATVLLFLGRYGDARVYATRAIELNPDYEYAYFRLGQSWDRETRPDKAKKTLEDYKRSVRIPQFKALFQKYNVPIPE